MSAIISPCGTYRYKLTREVGAGSNRVLFVMLNPSTADATQDDATIRSCTRFAREWGCSCFTVVNLFAYRATDPKELLRARGDIIGPENDRIVLEEIRAHEGYANPACEVVAAWGAHRAAQSRFAWFKEQTRGLKIMCLGTTKDGSPKHPLYLSPKTQLFPF